MSARMDPNFLTELKKYGDIKIESCFNCGNCSAICPLSTEEDNFPRKMNRLAQLGLRDRLIASKELWLCYYCGECTKTCPRQADPAEYMATARRYAIASYDPTGIARLFFTSPIISIFFMILLAIAMGAFFLSFSTPMNMETLRLFDFIPSQLIHYGGIIVGIFIIVVMLYGTIAMIKRISSQLDYPKGTRVDWIGAIWKAFGQEVLGQTRYRNDCDASNETHHWYLQKWFIHASILWGFLGLFIATALNYLLELLNLKMTGTWVPIWYPIRLLGTISGLFLLYGTNLAVIKRLRKEGVSYEKSTFSDWIFLILMDLAGITGFLLEIAVYLPPQTWSYWMLLAHLIVVGELLILAPFTKFAHAVYRSIALYFWALKPLEEKEKSIEMVPTN
jgi:ferredoxin